MFVRYYIVALFVIAAGSAVAEAAEPDRSAIGNGGGADAETSLKTDQPMFKFAGFGTLGLAHSSQNQGDYVLDSTIPKGPGRSRNWSADNDSRIAANVTANFTPKLTGLFQVVSEYQANSTYRPAVEWANLKYALTPNAHVQVGRIVLPTFLHSSNRDVGFSYPWVHPPVELYRQLAITGSDGVGATYRTGIGEAENSIKAVFGKTTIDRPTSVSTSRNMWGVFDTLEYGAATLHIGYQRRQSSSRNILTGITGPWIQNSDLSVGASYDPGDWFVMSEWIQRKSTTKEGAMYISAGARINKFTPYLTYSQASSSSFLPGFPPPTATGIQLAARAQSTDSVGLRWDFMKNTDFKVQYDLVKLSDNSNGYLANVPAGVILYGSRLHVISATVDFIF